jgi:hypothetical protein
VIAYTTPSLGTTPQFSTVDGVNPPVPSQLIAEAQPAPKLLKTYRFPQQLIPLDGGKTLLRLRKPLQLFVNQKTLEFDVEDWGIRMHCADVADLPRQIARRFLQLFSKADSRVLSGQETEEWLRILDQVDYTQFCVERSAPHYVEGTLIKKHPLTVEWHDGTTEHLPPTHASVFYPLDHGDQFSAFVKLGRENAVISIERVALIPS